MAKKAAGKNNAAKYVYLFGKGISDGNASMKNLLGGKGANLAEMANLNLPVPAGFRSPPNAAPLTSITE